jgi:hypothetical protein
MSHQSKSNDSLLAQVRDEEPVVVPLRSSVSDMFDRILILPFTKLPARLFCAMITFAVWAHAAAVFAQGKGKNQPAVATGEKSYVLPYVIVVLCIALGLLVVCRSGGRSNEPKLDDLE